MEPSKLMSPPPPPQAKKRELLRDDGIEAIPFFLVPCTLKDSSSVLAENPSNLLLPSKFERSSCTMLPLKRRPLFDPTSAREPPLRLAVILKSLPPPPLYVKPSSDAAEPKLLPKAIDAPSRKRPLEEMPTVPRSFIAKVA